MKPRLGAVLEFLGGIGCCWLPLMLLYPYAIGMLEHIGFKSFAQIAFDFLEDEQNYVIFSFSMVIGGLILWMTGRYLQGERI